MYGKENISVDPATLSQLFVELIYVGLVVGLVVEATLQLLQDAQWWVCLTCLLRLLDVHDISQGVTNRHNSGNDLCSRDFMND